MAGLEEQNIMIVGSQSEDPFTDDIGEYCEQMTEYSDLISLKTFANGEFCPRFISDEDDFDQIGNKLKGKKVVLISTDLRVLSRMEMAWRNLLVARAAKDNGADEVILVEPDLFFSAQDRGPRPNHGIVDFERDTKDYKKFDGQPFTSQLYGQMLAGAGVDSVITVHIHSHSVERLFADTISGRFLNLNPADVFADYIINSDVAPALHGGKGLLICAPDKGARQFATEVHHKIGLPSARLLFFSKQRFGERKVSSMISVNSPTPAEDIQGRDVIVFDDMVRTGGTIKECSRLLKDAGAGRVIFFVTHFHSSPEARENLSSPALDEIVTMNTLPYILNRDRQGRLRRKMTVLKIEKWLSGHILDFLGCSRSHLIGRQYTVDMSSKNPRSSKLKDRSSRNLVAAPHT